MRPDGEEGAAKQLEPWPEHVGAKNLWGDPLQTKSPELNSRVQDLGGDLQSIVREVSTGPLRDFQLDAGKYLRDLRREFLRHHRRLTVQARAEDGAERDELVTMLRSAQSDLAAHWRGIVLGRSVTLAKLTWDSGNHARDRRRPGRRSSPWWSAHRSRTSATRPRKMIRFGSGSGVACFG